MRFLLTPPTLPTCRGLAVDPAQTVITSGTQAALDLCARLLAEHGDTAWVENPGYLAARVALGLAGLRVHDVPVDDEGLASSEDDWHDHPPRLVMITPSHQYPTGRVMSLPRRLARPRVPGRASNSVHSPISSSAAATPLICAACARYAVRQVALRAALKAAFGSSVELSGGEAGLHLVMWLPDEIRDTAVENARLSWGWGCARWEAIAVRR